MGLEAMTPSPAPSRAAVKQLADERDAVERELAATVDALLAPGGGGLSGPLVDADGFPRVRWVDIFAWDAWRVCAGVCVLWGRREEGAVRAPTSRQGADVRFRRGPTSMGSATEWSTVVLCHFTTGHVGLTCG